MDPSSAAVNQIEANKFLTVTKYLYETSLTCYDKCVIDFQTYDIGAFEKDCAKACLQKHMAIYKDIQAK